MDNSNKKRKFLKIVLIILAVIGAIFLVLVLISKRPQHAGAGKTEVADYNARIDYRDEMNCRVGNKGDSNSFVVAATDGWSKLYVGDYDLNGRKVTIRIENETLYFEADSDRIKYDPGYFDYANNINLIESLKLQEGDSRKISCKGQETNLYDITGYRKFEDLTMKKAPHEEN